MKTVTKNIRLMMGYRNVWPTELNVKTRIPLVDINYILEDRKTPTKEQLGLIAKVLGVTVDNLQDDSFITLKID